MSPTLSRDRFPGLLAATAVATYLLVALGTAVSTTGSATACTTWPSCSSAWTLGSVAGEGLLFWGHRAAALVAGLLVAATAVAAWRLGVDRRIRLAIAASAALFPIQVALGAVLTTGGPAFAGPLHLGLAMAIFAGLLVALALALEAEALESDRTHDVDPAPSPSTADAPDRAVKRRDDTDAFDDRGSGEWRSSALRTASAYLELTKPRLMWLLCLVALAGMGLATLTGEPLSPGTVAATLAGGVLAIGASGTFNHVYERDRDRKMDRTAGRPLTEDEVPVRRAVGFGLALAAAAAIVMTTWVNALAAALTLAAVAYYALLYTVVLKPNTAWNTVLGGGAGALPAVIGWVAVTGSVGLPALVLAAVVFFWTPAHFYSLAIAYRDDYARGGFPMFPVVEGVLAARRHVLLYLGATMLAASLLGWIAGLGWVYALTSVALGVVFLRSVIRQYRVPTDEAALRSFYASNAYLGAILVAIVLETIPFAA